MAIVQCEILNGKGVVYYDLDRPKEALKILKKSDKAVLKLSRS